MQIEEIRPNVYACLTANETANAGFVATDQGVVVIDTFETPARGRELAAEIEGYTGKSPILVINTHHHFDHLFGNQAFEAPVVAHCALSAELADRVAEGLTPTAIAEWVAEHPEDRWLADELELVYPNIVFDRRLVLDLPPQLLVVRHLGGHTPDSAIVDLPDEDVVFAGDLIFEGRVPYLGGAHFGDLIQALRALERLGDRTVVPGHGELCDTAYVARYADYVESLYVKVGELVASGRSKSEVVESDQLPRWWTEDRPETLRGNIERLYDERAAKAGGS